MSELDLAVSFLSYELICYRFTEILSSASQVLYIGLICISQFLLLGISKMFPPIFCSSFII